MDEEADHIRVKKQLTVLLKKLTKPGQPALDIHSLKHLKKICRSSDLYVEHVFHFLMSSLKKKQAEIRFSCFLIIDELFNRSHTFREHLLDSFKLFVQLTVGTDTQHSPLPPPKSVANKLKNSVISIIHKWTERYGGCYKKLKLGYRYLKNCKQVNFDEILACNLAEQRRLQEQDWKKQANVLHHLNKARSELADNEEDIIKTATQAENCIKLLLPEPDALFSDDIFLQHVERDEDATNTLQPHCYSQNLSVGTEACDVEITQSYLDDSPLLNKQSESDCEGNMLSCRSECVANKHKPFGFQKESIAREGVNIDANGEICGSYNDSEVGDCGMLRIHGLRSHHDNFTVELDLNTMCVTETEDNRDLFSCLKESNQLIVRHYLPRVNKLLQVFTKTDATDSEITMLTDMKVRLEKIQSQCLDLHIFCEPLNCDHDSSDDDLEEVPLKEGFEPDVIVPETYRTGAVKGKTCNAACYVSELEQWREETPDSSFLATSFIKSGPLGSYGDSCGTLSKKSATVTTSDAVDTSTVTCGQGLECCDSSADSMKMNRQLQSQHLEGCVISRVDG